MSLESSPFSSLAQPCCSSTHHLPSVRLCHGLLFSLPPVPLMSLWPTLGCQVQTPAERTGTTHGVLGWPERREDGKIPSQLVSNIQLPPWIGLKWEGDASAFPSWSWAWLPWDNDLGFLNVQSIKSLPGMSFQVSCLLSSPQFPGSSPSPDTLQGHGFILEWCWSCYCMYSKNHIAFHTLQKGHR